jgi:hypothetical protein
VQTSFVYDDELLLFKQTYLRRCSTLLGQQLDDFVTFCIQVTEYLLDYQWVFDARYNLNRTTELLTGFNIDQVLASHFTPTDANVIPNGELAQVAYRPAGSEPLKFKDRIESPNDRNWHKPDQDWIQFSCSSLKH